MSDLLPNKFSKTIGSKYLRTVLRSVDEFKHKLTFYNKNNAFLTKRRETRARSERERERERKINYKLFLIFECVLHVYMGRDALCIT